jgi:hypothetical protein
VAAAIFASAYGTRAYITAAEANQLTTGSTILNRLVIGAVGVGMTVDIYDHASAATNPVWHYVTADGKVSVELGLPIMNGLRVVVGGAPGEVSVVFGGKL